jgi:hypothetical protein
MASLRDFVTTQVSGNPALSLADLGLQASDAATEAGLQQTRLMRDYSTRLLPDLINRHAARGTFYGGQVGLQADQLKEDVGNQYGDIQRRLQQQLADLRRRGILAATGVML